MNIRRDVSEVFGKKWQATEFLFQPVEEIISGTVNPAAIDCGRLAGRNLPELGEPAKVVQTDVVAGLGGPAEALQPPTIAVGANRIPVVEGIAPALACGAEVIRRHAGDDFRQEIVFP